MAVLTLRVTLRDVFWAGRVRGYGREASAACNCWKLLKPAMVFKNVLRLGLRRRSPSLKVFLNTMASFSSFPQLQAALAARP